MNKRKLINKHGQRMVVSFRCDQRKGKRATTKVITCGEDHRKL